jgi:isopentenyl-diphosphate delta-isomerase
MTIFIPAWNEGNLEPVEKLEVHRRGLKHKAISIFVFCGGKLLIQQRASNKYHSPELWANSCCSHPNWGESSEDCSNRRIFEELGLENLELRFIDQIEYKANVGSELIEHEVVDCFSALCQTTPKIKMNPEEVKNFAWVDIEQLRQDIKQSPTNYTQWFKIYLNEHFEKLFIFQ